VSIGCQPRLLTSKDLLEAFQSLVAATIGGCNLTTLPEPPVVQLFQSSADSTTTLNVYAHWMPSMGEATAAAMESAIG
jgi:hypothetical protein